jgi:peptidoglycan hydrolase-like protein with peptidoglycan-binding domain
MFYRSARGVPMAVSWIVWKDNDRIKRAERDAPAMRHGERGLGLHLLQAALILNGFDVPSHGVITKNSYGNDTDAAVRRVEQRFTLSIQDTGIAGTQVIGALDREADKFYKDHAGHFGRDLGVQDAGLALSKIDAARNALVAVRATLQPTPIPTPPALPFPFPVAQDALAFHFRLLVGAAGPAPMRAATIADLDKIIKTYLDITFVLRGATFTFQDGIPTNGVKIVAEAALGKQRPLLGPFYRDFDAPFAAKVGKDSRVAVLIHESMHSVDASGKSGRKDIHISEFDTAYNTQPPDKSLLNPSSYAGFAAHVFLGRDPRPRFGLGPPYPATPAP